MLPGFNELKSLNKKAKIYQKEYENLVQKRNRPLNAEMLLEKETKKLQETLAVLEKENTRLNTSKLYLPKIGPTNNISINLEEKYREVKALKTLISELQEKIINYPKESQLRHERFLKLTEKYKNLREEAGDYIKIMPDKRYYTLQKKLDVVTNSWNNNVSKYEQKIVELEEELENLKNSYMHLNAKSFKKSQQQRLLKMSYDEAAERNSGNVSLKPDIHHPGVSFLYKPSVKSLYNI